MTKSLPPSHFRRLYEANPDPWGFDTSSYELDKYRHTVEALGDRRFAFGLEVGCSIGVLTRMLAFRCDKLFGVDIVEDPLFAARSRCVDQPHVRFAKIHVPVEWPAEPFDLIVFSEVLYFLSAADIACCARRVFDTLLPGGLVVLVNWLGKTDDPSSADAAPSHFIAATSATLRIVLQERHEHYRLDILASA